MELTKDSSTETKKWENIVFRVNVLLSWTSCLVSIIVVCGLCFTSCTSDREQKDIELGKRLSMLKCGQTVDLMNTGQHSYLFKRFHYANGIVDLGGIKYPYQLSKKDDYTFYNLVGKDTSWYYQVKIYEMQASPGGGTVQCMQIKKVPGQYRYCVTAGTFELTLLEVKGSIMTIWIVNNSKHWFAYADMLPTQGSDPMLQQIRFSAKIHQTIDMPLGDKLVLYEYVETSNGIGLKETCRIPYIGRFFGL